MKTIKMNGKPKVVDLTRKLGTAETLSEARILCSKEEKDMYLYYFLVKVCHFLNVKLGISAFSVKSQENCKHQLEIYTYLVHIHHDAVSPCYLV